MDAPKISDSRTLSQKLATARSRLGAAGPMPPSCPGCGGSMMIRSARRGGSRGGNFWGCKRFPKCQGTLPA
jgi:restriction system protein